MRTSRAFLMVVAALGLVFAGVRGLPTWLMVGHCASSWVCDVINMVITSCFLALQHCAFCFASISSSLCAAWAVVRMVPACPRRLGLCLLPHSTPLLGRVPALAVAFNHIIISCKTWLAARCCNCDATLALFCDRVVVSCAMWVAAGNRGCGVEAPPPVPLPPRHHAPLPSRCRALLTRRRALLIHTQCRVPLPSRRRAPLPSRRRAPLPSWRRAPLPSWLAPRPALFIQIAPRPALRVSYARAGVPALFTEPAPRPALRDRCNCMHMLCSLMAARFTLLRFCFVRLRRHAAYRLPHTAPAARPAPRTAPCLTARHARPAPASMFE